MAVVVALSSIGLFGAPGAKAAPPKALINGATVSGSPSLEQTLLAAGWVVQVDTAAQWAAETAASFGTFDLLVIGDKSCSIAPQTAAQNAATWAPVVMGTAGGRTQPGNRIVIGTDPVAHSYAQPSRSAIIKDGLAFAGKLPGRTGLYFDASCGGGGGHVLAALNKLGATPTWTTGPNPPCATTVALIATEASFTTLTSASLQGWGCSVHETWTKWPSDWTPLAVATSAPTKPACGLDLATNKEACGQPYILIAGAGIKTTSSTITLAPANADNLTGTNHTVTAHVSDGAGAAVSGVPVTFTVTGQNAGATGTCVPASCASDASGDVTFTYTGANGAGTDTIKATYTSAAGATSSATAQKRWVDRPSQLCIQKFNDVNGNGKRDAGESLLAGWVFTVKDSAGNVVATVTSTTGEPPCIEVRPGTYTVTETLQAPWTPTVPANGIRTVTVAAGQKFVLTFGNRRVDPPVLCITKYNDLNGNGVQDAGGAAGPGEPLLGGWKFEVKDSAGNVITLTSSANGPVCIHVKPGTYTVTELLLPGWAPTKPAGGTTTVTIAEGQTIRLKFGNIAKPGQICLLKYNDLNGSGKQDPGEPLIDGWIFTVKDGAGNQAGTITSSVRGRVCLEVKPGAYTVTETVKPGWTPTEPASAVRNVTVGPGATVVVVFGNHELCCMTFTFPAGKTDGFSTQDGATAEPANPIPGQPQSYFDESASNKFFRHRFALPQGNCITSAKLQVRVKVNSFATNDSFRLQTAQGLWSRSLPALTGMTWDTAGQTKIVTLDLGALAPAGGTANLVPALNTARFLDVIMQDDTSMDSMVLTVEFCECSPRSHDDPK